ncbi:hypothetical protein L1987_24659 [Smallanthus sonchifolius]|uniref:Uncharacterized protein n=1 Tax=Smallanthus sonchifolius TaxID=185202 RepID=A0ACB9ILM7_9ASTR|nr:hypothetical protein L1987_24659 [Smallanthus sonchifolius]
MEEAQSSCQFGPECAACKHSYIDQEVKPASFMENIATIYRNLEATFNANVIHPVCSDMGKPSKMDVNNNLRKENVEITKEGNFSNVQSTTLQTAVPNLIFDSPENLKKCITPESVKKQGFKDMETGVDGVGFIQMDQLSPPLSRDSKDSDGNCSDPNSNHTSSVRYSLKRPAEKDAKCHHTLEGKRQKETDDGSDDMKLERNGHLQTDNLSSENVATVSCNSETASEKPVSGGQSDQLDLKSSPCAFCQCSKIAEIYFQKGIIKNLESEIARASKLKCCSCGNKGAVLGCYVKSCQKTYHVPCAYDIPDCRWDCEDFLLLCPKHVSHRFPKEKKSKAGKQDTDKRVSTNLNHCTTLLNGEKKLVLCGSALSSEQKFTMVDFARRNGALVSRYWKDDVTHVIAATDSNGACTRTLKVLMAILNGKWIVTMEWLKACVEAGHIVKEEPYEVHLDTHGCSGGPTAGRLRAISNAPKLFNNMKFYFIGDFVEAFKTDLLNLVKTAGGTISETKDQLLSSNYAGLKLDEATFVVYNADLSICAELEDEGSIKFQRLAAAEDVAQESGARVVGHTWILESIAACSLMSFT